MRWPEYYWYRTGAVDRAFCLPLWPLSFMYGALTALRRVAYRTGICASTRLPVPVIVVGNIAVGGTGKTPLTIALAEQLRRAGFHPGILSRGYGGNASAPQAVTAASDPRLTGDEAVLLARRGDCPVWIGANRVAAGRRLLAAHPHCDLLISDDGLQHYALARDFEIAVIDASRGLGNGWLLPAGPLREPLSRLAHVDAVVMHGDGAPPLCSNALFRMHLQGDCFSNLHSPQQQVGASHFSGRSVHAVAAIGNPQRFFSHLRTLGIEFTAHPFADHHAFTPSDLAFGDDAEIIMTGKDAVKCERFADNRHWALQVNAALDGDLAAHITRQLGKPR